MGNAFDLRSIVAFSADLRNSMFDGDFKKRLACTMMGRSHIRMINPYYN